MALTGETKHEAMLVAVRERLARLKGPVSVEERTQHALALLRQLCGPRTGPVPTRKESDRALGYRSEGV
jgi:hypothetical protein